ncbi:MAG: alpha-galactosidase [Clostridia bacterium]|nr:alpha-galactosidase [Clostridia bacterium]
MSVIISSDKITIETKNTLYVIKMLEGVLPIHLYYGKKISEDRLPDIDKSRPFSPYFKIDNREYSLDNLKQEFSFYGYGDFRATALRVLDLSSGSDITDYTFKEAKSFVGRKELNGLPYSEGECETLELVYEDSVTESELCLYYTVFYDTDVISRYFVLKNNGNKELKILKAMSLSLDLPDGEYDLISLRGRYARERTAHRDPIYGGNHRIMSRRGASSHHFNPFFMVTDRNADEESGDAYAFNFVYSGSFLDEIELGQDGLRIMTGLGDECFSYLLKSGESFNSPEAVMTYSENGIGQASRNMHSFVRDAILPKSNNKKRPIVLNSWEAVYFNIDQDVMLDFAEEAAKVGIDTFVMDDGWFGARRSDNAGLGDWTPTPEIFPDGLGAFVEKVHAKGIDFGIWIEPEMVNPDSDLYRAHPEWVLRDEKREPLRSRHQLVLDMANPQVVEYIKESLDKCFDGMDINYFKWDMNRNISNAISPYLPIERKGETQFRYMLGVYELFGWFKKRFPDAMLEKCSGGGGRYDLGMMKYSTQIWTSDNTEAKYRVHIQHGSSYGYPMSTMSCHVSNCHGQCEDERMLDYCFKVAINGPLGYEFNILKAEQSVKDAISKQIAEYREYEELILNGDFYRLKNPSVDRCYAYYITNADKSEILLSYLQNNVESDEIEHVLKISCAKSEFNYRNTLTNEIFSGSALKEGIIVKADTVERYGLIWHFVAE